MKNEKIQQEGQGVNATYRVARRNPMRSPLTPKGGTMEYEL
jgi:hypothetical protein